MEEWGISPGCAHYQEGGKGCSPEGGGGNSTRGVLHLDGGQDERTGAGRWETQRYGEAQSCCKTEKSPDRKGKKNGQKKKGKLDFRSSQENETVSGTKRGKAKDFPG